MHLDLNLLDALDVLLEERSVFRAAERLHLSQPAMSRTLGRIRAATGDRILIRVGHRMEPTSYAVAIQQQVRTVVRQSKEILQPRKPTDLATIKRTFTISMNELVLSVFAWQLLQRVRAAAPGIQLRLVSETSIETNELQQDRIDLQLNADSATSPFLCKELTLRDELALAVRTGHPLARGRLSVERYAAGEHVIVSRRGRLRDVVDVRLENLGLRRTVIAATATTEAALSIVRKSNCFVMVPKRVCERLKTPGISLIKLPVPTEPVALYLTWHTRHHDDAVHAWFCSQIKELAS